jgi:hypothetical protein
VSENKLSDYWAMKREGDEAMLKLSEVILKIQGAGHEACLKYTPEAAEGAGELEFFARFCEEAKNETLAG